MKLFVIILALVSSIHAANFSTGPESAVKFGIHEIVLSGDGSVPNPFNTISRVTFTSPSGKSLTVRAFYDGANLWRARVYLTESGEWHWTSSCQSDSQLDGHSGSFQASDSQLRGMLRKHRSNPKAWMTDDGQWFPNISDTGYRLFHAKEAPDWKEFIRQSAAKGNNCMRAAALGGWGGTPGAPVDDNNTWVWNDPWAGGSTPDHERFDLAKFQTTDQRLIWSLENHPEMFYQMILFSFKGYGGEGTGQHWESLPAAIRENTMQYMLIRWSAFPNVFWQIVNDMHCTDKFPKNQAFVREVGKFFAASDPWHHLLSTGPNRHAGFPFTTKEDLKWCSYIYIEDSNAVGADQIQKFDAIPLHVWMGEDYYEQDHGHYQDPRYYFRWLAWSWLLSGGSANYCGRWGPIDPYDTTASPDRPWNGIDKKTIYTGEKLVGLDSYPYLVSYLRDRQLDLSLFKPNDPRVRDDDGAQGKRRPKLMERGTDEFLIYHPNAAENGFSAAVSAGKPASLVLDLKDASGSYNVEWYRPFDGIAQNASPIAGGQEVLLQAPWQGQDVVLRLNRFSGPIRVSTNGRYFVDNRNDPFYFLADTQWELFRRYSLDQAKLILENRKAKGFSVIMVMLTGVGPGIEPNLAGDKPWINGDPTSPNPLYFEHVDAVLKIARENDLQLLIGIYHQTYGARMTLANARPWATWVTTRYRDTPNIIWTLYPKANDASRPLIARLAEGIQEGDRGTHLLSIHPDPSPASSSFMHAEPWLAFNSIQVWKDLRLIYPMTLADYEKSPTKPVTMLEGAYENGEEYGYPVTPLLVRREAYYTCLAGGFHGYGHNDSWRVRPGWRAALDHPGARQMTILKNTFTSLPEWWTLTPDPSILTRGGNIQGDVLNLAARSATGQWLICYIAGEPNITLNMSKITTSDAASAEWIDPAAEAHLSIGTFPSSGTHDFSRPPDWRDAILVIKSVQPSK